MSSPSRVLVVEDMPALRDHVVETVAEMPGLVVDAAQDGREALARIAAAPAPYDLIVSDIIMPHLDGEALLAELRQRGVPTPVIMLTALGQDDVVVRCLRGGAADYLVKPASIEDIHAAVANALAQRPHGDIPVDVAYDPNGWFEVRAGSDPSVLYRYRRFLGLLERFRMPEPAAGQIRLALEELGRNAIEWGNRGDRSKKVVLGCRILPGKVIIAIEDEGEGFVPDHVPDPSLDPIAHIEARKASGKRLGGYGLHLIRNLMDKVVYNAKGNRVVAIKYLALGGGPSA